MTMNTPTVVLIGLGCFCLFLVVGCAPRGRPLRPSPAHPRYSAANAGLATANYIESRPINGGKPFSCSFIEFDERGDYLDFEQHREAYNIIKTLGTNGERLLVLIYVHGWKNNSQSGDVVKFNNFLERLATSQFARDGKFRVHGIYLAWRGNAVRHGLDQKSQAFGATTNSFGGPIVDTSYARSRLFGWLYWLPEQLSYWSRKGAAEDKVSGVSLVRTIFTCAYTAQRYGDKQAVNRVFLMGHSFGALMLEQSFLPSSLSALTGEWPWDDEGLIAQARANPLPFDLVMLVNSAAPSIYAKQFYGYMVAHRSALVRNKIVGSDAPLVISLTSSADWATGKAHKWGNILAPLTPSLWRQYDGRDFILKLPATATNVTIPQWYYYRRTPGHNPLLVNHWIVPADASSGPTQIGRMVQEQSDPAFASVERTFRTSPRKAGGEGRTWKLTTVPPEKEADWASYKGYKPLGIGERAVASGYWIIRCPKQIIAGHNDVWSQQAMDTYEALFHETEFLRQAPPRQ